MTLARVAVQLDPANELDDFQAVARALLAHGWSPSGFPRQALWRSFDASRSHCAASSTGCAIGVSTSGPTCARLFRRPAATSHYRPARYCYPVRRAFTPQAYASLCMVLAAIEGLGEQTTIRQLADEVARLRAGDEALPFDLTTRHAHRRAFVDAVAWLRSRDVLVLLDGDTEAFLAARVMPSTTSTGTRPAGCSCRRPAFSPVERLRGLPRRAVPAQPPRARRAGPAIVSTGGSSPKGPCTTTSCPATSATTHGSGVPVSRGPRAADRVHP